MLSRGDDDHGKLRRCDHYKAVPQPPGSYTAGCRGDHGTEQGLAGDAENGCPDVEADFIERLVMRVFDELVEVGARGGRAGSSVREVDVRAGARRR